MSTDFQSEAAELIKGSIDTHIHSAPDVVPRRRSDLEIALDAQKAGMRAVMLTCHIATTEGRAALVEQMVPGIKVFGGICLNSYAGGLNPVALQISIKMGAKNVWMPTVSSANHINFFALSAHMAAVSGRIKEKGITICNEDGLLKPEVYEILKIVKENNIIVSTGNMSARESVILVEEALRQGIQKILYSHPDGPLTKLGIEEQKRLASQGVFFERCWSITTEASSEKTPFIARDLADIIKTVGSQTTVMASDGGMIKNPPPVEQFQTYVTTMLSNGISPKEIEMMTKTNPAQLLGI